MSRNMWFNASIQDFEAEPRGTRQAWIVDLFCFALCVVSSAQVDTGIIVGRETKASPPLRSGNYRVAAEPTGFKAQTI